MTKNTEREEAAEVEEADAVVAEAEAVTSETDPTERGKSSKQKMTKKRNNTHKQRRLPRDKKEEI